MFSFALAPSGTERVLFAPRQARRGNTSAAARARNLRASSNDLPPLLSGDEAEMDADDAPSPPSSLPRRRQALAAAALAAAAALSSAPLALAAFQPPGFKKNLAKGGGRRPKLPAEAFSQGPEGLKYYDFKVGTGPEATLGDRVVVHYEARWKGVTFMTSRQGMGVTGGNPLGFDVGAKAGAGGTLKGLDLGVRGMRVGGQRRLLVPPELGYGSKGVGEVPGGAELEFEVELLSVKNSPLGYRVKLVEG